MDTSAGDTFGNWDACKETGSSGTGGAETGIDQGLDPHGGAKEQLSGVRARKMRIFCFPSTETGGRKGEPCQRAFSALPFPISPPELMAVSMEEPAPCVCPECVSTMGTLEETRGMKGRCVHSAGLLVCQQQQRVREV